MLTNSSCSGQRRVRAGRASLLQSACRTHLTVSLAFWRLTCCWPRCGLWSTASCCQREDCIGEAIDSTMPPDIRRS